MTPELQAAIEDAYRVFEPYGKGGSLIVCFCPVCMTNESEQSLVATPLRDTPSGLLAEYTNSAHGMDEAIAREFRHFLPRYFELIALDDPPDNMGLAICLRRLGFAPWRATWPSAEVAIIDRFFDTFAADAVHHIDTVEWPVGHRLRFNYADVLTLVATAGGDIDRVLGAWDRAPDPPAALHMAALRGDVLYEHDRTYLYSAYLPDHRDAADRIGAFLVRPEVTQRIEAAFFVTTVPELQQILSDGLNA